MGFETSGYYRVKNKSRAAIHLPITQHVVSENGSLRTRIANLELLDRRGHSQRQAGNATTEPGPREPETNSTGLELDELILPAGKTLVLEGKDLNMVNEKTLNFYEQTGQISLKELDICKRENYMVKNETARRIGIRSYQTQGDHLIIPPFGSRLLNSEILRDYDFLDWKRQSLITVDLVAKKQNETAQMVFGLLVTLLVLFLLVSIPLAIFTEAISWATIGIISLIFILAQGVSLYFASGGRRLGSGLWEWFKMGPGIILVLLAGVGLPLAIVYFFGDGQHLIGIKNFELAALGRMLQVGFISIASILPALLYFLFGRLQIEKLRDNFFREVMLLDPNIQTLSEARTKYDPLLDSVYGSGNSPFAILLLFISTALLVMGWITALSPVGSVSTDTIDLVSFFTPNSTAFTLGFMGAYFFTVNMIFRRYVRSDLTPKTYAHITVRLLITLVLVWAVASLPQFTSGAVLTTGLLAVAFIIGIFPETGLALIKDYVRQITRKYQDDDNSFPLTDMEGMNLYDRARLLEEGIENIENLAHHNLVELIARTRIPTPRLVDMFDQSLLYLNLGITRSNPDNDDTEKDPDGTPESQGKELLTKMKSFGIRTASDLHYAVTRYRENKEDSNLGMLPINRLEIIADTIKGDGWMNFILNWHEMFNSVEQAQVTNPYKFYRDDMPLELESIPENGRGSHAEAERVSLEPAA